MSDVPEQTPDQPEKKPWWKRKWGIALIALAVIAFLGSLADEPEETDTASDEQTEAPTEQQTSELPAAEETPVQAEPAPTLEGTIAEALGDGNRDVPKVADVVYNEQADGRIIVTWAIDENLTEGLTKDTARIEAVKILQAIREFEPTYAEVFLEGTYPLVDQFGNEEEETVVRATYSKATVERINFDNFNFKNAFEVADSAAIHPAFQY